MKFIAFICSFIAISASPTISNHLKTTEASINSRISTGYKDRHLFRTNPSMLFSNGPSKKAKFKNLYHTLTSEAHDSTKNLVQLNISPDDALLTQKNVADSNLNLIDTRDAQSTKPIKVLLLIRILSINLWKSKWE